MAKHYMIISCHTLTQLVKKKLHYWCLYTVIEKLHIKIYWSCFKEADGLTRNATTPYCIFSKYPCNKYLYNNSQNTLNMILPSEQRLLLSDTDPKSVSSMHLSRLTKKFDLILPKYTWASVHTHNRNVLTLFHIMTPLKLLKTIHNN